jgi:hypothetical protein
MTAAPTTAQRSDCRPLPTAIHEPDVGMHCVHLIGVMPRAIMVDRGAVGRLNFQPRVMSGPQPVIAARRGDTLILSVDMVGRLGNYHPRRGTNGDRRLTHHWYFDLYEDPDDPRFLFAVRQHDFDCTAQGDA